METSLNPPARAFTAVHSIDSRLTHRERIDDRTARRVMRRAQTRDDMMTYDQNTVDSAGVFLIGELEKLDQRLHMPLASYTWSRDIDLREDVSMADEESSFTNSTFGSTQGITGSNKAWAGKLTTTVGDLSLDIGKTIQPLNVWALELSWTLLELASAQKLGRPIDQQKFMGLQLKYQMDVDELSYMGDTILGMNGMLNHSAMSNVGNAVTGNWATSTPSLILADINSLLSSVWAASGWAEMPDRLLLSPTEYNLIRSTLISTAGNISILKFLEENNAAVGVSVRPFKILPCKWLLGTNNSGNGPTATNSMYAYVKDPVRIRLPLVPLQRTQLEFRGIRQIVTYYGRLGSVELVYPTTTGRRSNLG